MRLVLLSGATVLYKESAVTSARAVVLILLLSCAGKVAIPCTSGIWLTIDTLSARAS